MTDEEILLKLDRVTDALNDAMAAAHEADIDARLTETVIVRMSDKVASRRYELHAAKHFRGMAATL